MLSTGKEGLNFCIPNMKCSQTDTLKDTGKLVQDTAFWGGPFLRVYFLLRLEDRKRVPSLSYSIVLLQCP